MASQPPVLDEQPQPAVETAPAEAQPRAKRSWFGPARSARPPLRQVLRELNWGLLLLVGIGTGLLWVSLIGQGGSLIPILAGLLPVTAGIIVGRRIKAHVGWHAAVLGLLTALSSVIASGILIAIQIRNTGAISPTLLSMLSLGVVTLLPFPAFGVITAARSEERARAGREEQERRGGRLDRPGRVRSLDDLRALSLPQLGGYVADLFRKHDFLINDYRFEKDRLDFQVTHSDEPWLIRVTTAEKVKPGVAQELLQRMKAEGINKGLVVTSMDFQDGAIRSMKDKPVVLLDGETLLSMDD